MASTGHLANNVAMFQKRIYLDFSFVPPAQVGKLDMTSSCDSCLSVSSAYFCNSREFLMPVFVTSYSRSSGSFRYPFADLPSDSIRK